MNLHRNIRALRKEHAMTQEQLAEIMGVSTASVSKWESAQVVPELSMLVELAAYFGVSVDMLVGHTIEPDRVEAQIVRMKALWSAQDYNACAAAAEVLVRNYPNDCKVLEDCSDQFYNLYMSTFEREHMGRSIELMKRLMAAEKDPSGAKRFERLSRLANQHELLQDWETAEAYYKEGNVAGLNDRALARCLANAGKDAAAFEKLSEVFKTDLFWMVQDACVFADLLVKQEKIAEADTAMNWACTAFEQAGGNLGTHFAEMLVVLYVKRACMAEGYEDMQKAEVFIRKAAEIASGKKIFDAPDFVDGSKLGVMLGNAPKDGAALLQLLEMSPQLQEIAKAAME